MCLKSDSHWAWYQILEQLHSNTHCSTRHLPALAGTPKLLTASKPFSGAVFGQKIAFSAQLPVLPACTGRKNFPVLTYFTSALQGRDKSILIRKSICKAQSTVITGNYSAPVQCKDILWNRSNQWKCCFQRYLLPYQIGTFKSCYLLNSALAHHLPKSPCSLLEQSKAQSKQCIKVYHKQHFHLLYCRFTLCTFSRNCSCCKGQLLKYTKIGSLEPQELQPWQFTCTHLCYTHTSLLLPQILVKSFPGLAWCNEDQPLGVKRDGTDAGFLFIKPPTLCLLANCTSCQVSTHWNQN